MEIPNYPLSRIVDLKRGVYKSGVGLQISIKILNGGGIFTSQSQEFTDGEEI